MSDFQKYSRVNKFEKRRKTTKMISILAVVGSLFLLSLIVVWIFGGGGETDQVQDNKKNQAEENNQAGEKKIDLEEDTKSEAEENDTEEEETEGTIEKQPLASTDANVVEAYTANWKPIGTEQVGPHVTQFEKETQDWIEMEKAIRLATELEEDDMITVWIGNDGEQKVVGTVTNREKTKNYRVYLSWIDNEGWQPTKVEVLRSLDY